MKAEPTEMQQEIEQSRAVLLAQILKESRLRKWLESKPTEEYVGFPCDEWSCPLAMFMRQNGLQSVRVTPCILIFSHSGCVVDLTAMTPPAWAQRFIMAVDATYQNRGRKPLKAWQAIEIMDSLRAAELEAAGQQRLIEA